MANIKSSSVNAWSCQFSSRIRFNFDLEKRFWLHTVTEGNSKWLSGSWVDSIVVNSLDELHFLNIPKLSATDSPIPTMNTKLQNALSWQHKHIYYKQLKLVKK